MTRFLFALLTCASIVASAGAAPLRDGKRFDPAAAMTEPASGANPEVARPLWSLGQWDVTFRVYADGVESHVSKGAAEITLLNRGHAYMERFHCPDFDGEGHDLDTVSFLTYDASTELWVLGMANGFTETVRLVSGGFEDGALVLRDASRPLGGSRLVHTRLTIAGQGDAFTATMEASIDNGSTWTRQFVREYARRAEPHAWFAPANGVGEAAPDLPAEARQFDFFLGRFDEAHWMKLPSGEVSFPVNGSAVRCLNGRGVLEFGWYDVDPRLPDAATSIVRVYNRQMRQWETMFLSNRFNAILYFGGVMEGERLVLHRFAAGADDNPISRWVFHDWTDAGYKWHAETSTDRGATWDTTWTIDATRIEMD